MPCQCYEVLHYCDKNNQLVNCVCVCVRVCFVCVCFSYWLWHPLGQFISKFFTFLAHYFYLPKCFGHGFFCLLFFSLIKVICLLDKSQRTLLIWPSNIFCYISLFKELLGISMYVFFKRNLISVTIDS